MLKQIVIIVQTVVIVGMAALVYNMKMQVDKAIHLTETSRKMLTDCQANTANAINEATKSQALFQKTLEFSQTLVDKIKVYEESYGKILMPGESMQIVIPLSKLE